MKSSKNITKRVLRVTFISLFYFFVFSFRSASATPGIKIISPPDKSVVHPGEEITVTVDAVDGFSMKDGMLLFSTKEKYNEDITSLPVTRTFRVPQTAIGTVVVLAVASDIAGEPVGDQITLAVQQTAALQSLIVFPKTLSFSLDWSGGLDKTGNDYGYLGVEGVYADGVTRDVTRQGTTFSSTDPSVISIDGEGKYKILKAGDAKILVANSGVTAEVPIVFSKPIGLPRNETIPPTTTIEIDPSPNPAGWYNTDVTVHLTAVDNEGGSGVQCIYYEFSNIGKLNEAKGDAVFIKLVDEGRYDFYYYAQDKDINTEKTSHKTPFNIDKTLPAIAIDVPKEGASYTLNSSVAASWSATDALSGIASVTGTVASGEALDTSAGGQKTFTVTATDIAGNTTTTSVTYFVPSYVFGGVLPPVNPDGSSIFKLGRVAPVKFQLRDKDGNFVSTAQARIFLSKVSDSVAGTVLEAESAGEANSGNAFRYDPATNQYVFNLGTKNLSRGTWQIKIELDDGSLQYVNISLK